ncbi:hypothetical protein [Frateuria defendens]|uniref:hypothetical protein n=1 Tax=Frateuria defendens TaxID=2219559 RepID=UPI00066FECEE|nr:hypothetical protein [Frateuria defendens]
MTNAASIDAEEARLQQQLRIERMKLQLSRVKGDKWLARFPVIALGIFALFAVCTMGVILLVAAERFAH